MVIGCRRLAGVRPLLLITVLDAVPVFDALLCILLLVGNLLGLPIWWWLFGTPFVRLWRWCRSPRPR